MGDWKVGFFHPHPHRSQAIVVCFVFAEVPFQGGTPDVLAFLAEYSVREPGAREGWGDWRKGWWAVLDTVPCLRSDTCFDTKRMEKGT